MLVPVEWMWVLMADYRQRIRADHPDACSTDLLNNLSRHPRTRAEYGDACRSER